MQSPQGASHTVGAPCSLGVDETQGDPEDGAEKGRPGRGRSSEGMQMSLQGCTT